jgi:RNA-directed DNA polymerase
VDSVSIVAFPDQFRPQWPGIRRALMEGRYRPSPVRKAEIPKPDGGTRQLGIPTVLDRLIQQAIAQILTPIIDPTFSDHSHGFRPGRSAHDAVREVQVYVREGYGHAVDADLSKFFDRVNHDVLMVRLSRHVRDKRVLRLIGLYLRAGVRDEHGTVPSTDGVPQGGPLSPLLANVVLDDLDRELERRGHRFARYADDFIILVGSRSAGERVMRSVTRFLEKQLKLVVNERKSKVAPVGECSFLGFTFAQGGKIRWTAKSFVEFKRRVKRYTSRSWGVSMSHRLGAMRRYVRGWMNYYGISEYYRPLPGLDEWLRRRVRMCYWKQWRRPRTRMRELIRLGTHRRTAIVTGRSRKGYWRLSRTMATQTGMTNAWLTQQGLVSIRELWIAVQYPNQNG